MICWLTTDSSHIFFKETEITDFNQGITINFIPRRAIMLVAMRCDKRANSKLGVANDAPGFATLHDFSELVAHSISGPNTTGFT